MEVPYALIWPDEIITIVSLKINNFKYPNKNIYIKEKVIYI